jgi:hypothetical protein
MLAMYQTGPTLPVSIASQSPSQTAGGWSREGHATSPTGLLR